MLVHYFFLFSGDTHNILLVPLLFFRHFPPDIDLSTPKYRYFRSNTFVVSILLFRYFNVINTSTLLDEYRLGLGDAYSQLPEVALHTVLLPYFFFIRLGWHQLDQVGALMDFNVGRNSLSFLANRTTHILMQLTSWETSNKIVTNSTRTIDTNDTYIQKSEIIDISLLTVRYWRNKVKK